MFNKFKLKKNYKIKKNYRIKMSFKVENDYLLCKVGRIDARKRASELN